MRDIPSCLPVSLWQWSVCVCVCLCVSECSPGYVHFIISCVCLRNSCTTVLIYPWCAALAVQVYQQQCVKSVYLLCHCARESARCLNESWGMAENESWQVFECVRACVSMWACDCGVVWQASSSLLPGLIKEVLKLPLSHHRWHRSDRLITDRKRKRERESERWKEGWRAEAWEAFQLISMSERAAGVSNFKSRKKRHFGEI